MATDAVGVIPFCGSPEDHGSFLAQRVVGTADSAADQRVVGLHFISLSIIR